MTPPGPSVVALGGGHGLAATLSAVRLYAGEVTAIVSVADDGGSSGRLRRDYDVPPPGDLRKCLVALAEPGSPWAAAFEHRFEGGELDGHPLGNLILAGLATATGDFARALSLAAELMGTRGRVLPATTAPVVLRAVLGARGNSPSSQAGVQGQVAVAASRGILGVSLVPPDARPPAAALDAIACADQVIIGPGSLFTSVLAVVAVPALGEALARTPAVKIYVANLRASQPETVGFDLADHVAALAAHGLEVDVVLAHPGALPRGITVVKTVEVEVAAANEKVHDPQRLALALQDLVG
ncbi:MAG: gluconeogenesis factor YvcK family protein [Acidimicrobiales bacterium]